MSPAIYPTPLAVFLLLLLSTGVWGYPDDIMRYVYGRPTGPYGVRDGPALPTDPRDKHPMLCQADGCQQAARIKVDGVGYCLTCAKEKGK